MLTVALRRWGAWIVIADGLDGLIMQAFAPTYWSATRFIDYVAVDLHTGGFLLLAVGLAAIHERQGHAGLFERVGFLVAFVGAALAGVGNFAEDGLRVAAAGWAFMGGMLLLGTGLLLFGIASLRARMLPHACSVLLLLSLVVGYPLGGLGSNWGGTVLLALVWIALGCFLILNEPNSRGMSSPTATTRHGPFIHRVHSMEEG